MTRIYVDADACPVKAEAIRVAERHGIETFLVSNGGIRPSGHPLVREITVPGAFDAADDWIVEQVNAGDIVITADIPLASRCLEKQASVIGPTGKPFSKQNIGMALAMRDVMADLRAMGTVSGYNKSFAPADRSRFLNELERMVQQAKRASA
ncbi:YaiI/YqxD family protein [Pedomonas mirosovicensis]|uniref:YaiI/YqxD family protein n=1 Tax=Pedomonas mirosovicensis TaxID=2908641 RepID=UPI002169D9CF|nr:YaiI/YqxD family protein [Pedomonas mirosovicensis]MCH8685327.1 YaiI/YqxD family protein [Pedomonas mirosovicensis]